MTAVEKAIVTICLMLLAVPLGALAGYLAGCVVAGSFFLIEGHQRRRGGREQA
jgi:hypothetical protein